MLTVALICVTIVVPATVLLTVTRRSKVQRETTVSFNDINTPELLSRELDEIEGNRMFSASLTRCLTIIALTSYYNAIYFIYWVSKSYVVFKILYL